MHETKKTYDLVNKSEQVLPFEAEQFPAILRLVKWKVLDICVLSVTSHSIGEFERFQPLIPRHELQILVEKIMNTEIPRDPLLVKIANSKLDEKTRKQAECYMQFKSEHAFQVEKRKNVEYFFRNAFFNEEGLRIADQLLFDYDQRTNSHLYEYLHMTKIPANWHSYHTFIEKFFNEEELENPIAVQKLDKVVGCARGNSILDDLNGNSLFSSHYMDLKSRMSRSEYEIQSNIVRKVLDEGPNYKIRKENEMGEPKKESAVDTSRINTENWTEHKTRILFLCIPGFKISANSDKSTHEDWYYCLMESMSKDACNRASLFFLNRNYEADLLERKSERERQRLLTLKGITKKEEGIGEEVVTEIRRQPKKIEYQPDVEVDSLKLRSYQEELVQPALEGRNCVLVAPTGSGKTEVAIYAALNHMKERETQGKASRVVMLVPKIPLVGQQRDRFLKYCRGQYRVDGFHGSEKGSDGIGRRDEVLQSDVVVMTPQILINMLQSVRRSERLYVCDFSMIIFDEVHKATGNHPYVGISKLVQEWEHEKPQIIGLTASLNVSTTGNIDQNRMLESIYEMLALLNAPSLSTIMKPENIEELNGKVGRPDDTVEVCEPPSDERCVLRGNIQKALCLYHTKLCIELERLSTSKHSSSSMYNYKNFKKFNLNNYEKYESLLQNVIQDLNRMNTAEKANAQLYTKYIKVYVQARGIVEVMPPSVAFKYMQDSFQVLDKTHTLDQFDDFSKNYEALKRASNEDANPNIVVKLKETLVNQFRNVPESRAIIFVTQRNTAQRVCEFLNDSGVMNEFNSGGTVVGYVLGSNNQGIVQQTAEMQRLTIERFNNGKLKVIVATSVVEEGLDIAACNLIIKYNCSSDSPIQLIQQRGRARAKNSRSVLLAVHSKVNDKENNALIAEKHMRHCVSTIMKSSQKTLQDNVERLKKKIEAERQRELQEMLSMRARHENKMYDLKCCNCSRSLCEGSKMRQIFSNYMAMDPFVWEKLLLEPRKKERRNNLLSEDTQALSNILCHCKQAIGKAYKMRGVYLPQLDVRAISFLERGTGQCETKAKWSAVVNELFYIPEAQQGDFEIMLNALDGSEDNLVKKRILDLDSQHHMKMIQEEAFRQEDFDRKKQEQKKDVRQQKTIYSDDEEEPNQQESEY
ncbi:unnamed protein product [Caenorhabditis sp. 36 PRJEB53466]|nr:unnamed protein product [Caenorhabditis sp. 36 PRJEB53466]